MADPKRFRIKQTPTDVWSVRERLALASSVSRSGDQNWVSVSRAVRPFGLPNRPADWFSQKNCALQYSELLENVETPRRKRNEREAVETPGDVIVRKLTIERIEELKKLIAMEAEEYRSVKKDLEAVKSGQYDGHIKEMYEQLQADKVAAVAAAAKAAAEEAAAREKAKAAALKLKKSVSPLSIKPVPSSDVEDSTQDSTAFDASNNEDSNLSSIATPGPSQMPENGTSTVESPAPSYDLPSSPKTEMNQKVEESVAKDTDSAGFIMELADDLDLNVPEKIEIKQESHVVDETVVKVEEEEEVVNGADIKTEEEEEAVIEEGSQDFVCSAVEEVEAKAELPMPGNGESLFAKEDATDDELIPFTPAADDEESPVMDASAEVGTKELVEMTSPIVDQDPAIDCANNKAAPEVLMEETIVEAEEVAAVPVPEEEDEVFEEMTVHVEVELEEQKTDEIQQEVEVKPDGSVTAAGSFSGESSKAEEVVAPTIEPESPASSIMSTETGSVHSKKSTKRGRGRRPRKNKKRSTNRGQRQSEEGKESGQSSKEGETSDEEMTSREQPADAEDSLLLSSLPQHLDPSESLPNSPASLSHSDTEDEKSHRVWKKSIMLVWRAAANHKCASVFQHPVTEDIAPGYHSIVHKPMDLQKIKRKIDNGEIRTTAEFQRDMMLMFTNAIMYNNSDHDVHKMAKNMYKDVMGHIEQFVSTQIMVQSEPKLLRTLRRTDAIHSDKEDDLKRKRTGEQETTPVASGAKVKKRRI